MSDIILPPRNYDVIGGPYGSDMVAANYCGLSSPAWSVNGEWQHGWIVKERNIHPESVVGTDGKSFGRRENGNFFVAREDQEIYLRSCGYKHVVEIGLPIIYLPGNKLNRIEGSLLVMPMHSLPESNEQWNDDEYMEYIQSISRYFSRIVVCIHSSCMTKGNWNAFIKAGYEVVTGAEGNDVNSLQRMADLLSQFEYVTSNNFGSHVAYASYFGCKVSVIGPRINFSTEDHSNLTLYKNVPELLDITGVRYSKDYMFKTYSQFVVNPWQATTHQEWAAWELGVQNKKSPSELIQLFGWNYRGRIKNELRKFYRLSRKLYRALRTLFILQRYSGLTPAFVALIQLEQARKKQEGLCNIWLGWQRRIKIRNGSSDIDVFKQHFLRREILDINFSHKHVKTIIDLGANIGVSVEVFHRLFPDANIIAVELEKENAALCSINHEGNNLVTIINGAIWSASGRVGLNDIGDGAWAFQVSEEDQSNTVPAYTYSDILKMNNIESVDIMKMDIEGAEAEVLEASAHNIFSTTAISIIEVHDWIEGVKERVSKIIEEFKKNYDLDISHNGEFLIIKNMELLNK